MPAAIPPSPTPVTSPGIVTNFQPEAFGRYYLVDKVAVGGMAEVFKAKTFSDAGFEKLQVIKRILQHLSGNEEFIGMFIDEAKISVELHHPNIVQIYDFGRIGESYFIAMECVEGKDVKAILRKLAVRRKLLPAEYAVYVAHEIAKGLDYAHKKTNLKGEPLGIIHRDMSPSNVLVSYTGDVKIADFGIAKAQTSLYDTRDGVLKGKFEYMSPEQASGGTVTHQSDIFGAGIILYEMLTGRRLFKTESEVKTLEKIKAGDYPPPSTLNPAIPRRLDDLVMRALSPDLNRRYADAKEFQSALLEYMYPATPDVTRESLSYFLLELFAEELEQERYRLEAGTAMAYELHRAKPELDLQAEWEVGSGGSATLATHPARWLLLLAGVAVVMLTVVAIFLAMIRPEPEVVEVARLVEAPRPTHGSLQLMVEPAVPGRVTVGGVPVGDLEDGEFVFNEVPPATDIVLAVEADGYETYTDTVNVSAGERLRLPVRLVPVAVAPPPRVDDTPRAPRNDTPPAQVETPAPGVVAFQTSPSGASVYVDGALVGRTPTRWSAGSSGQSYRVEYRLDGYNESAFTMSFPEAGESSAYTRTLQKKAAEPGKVTVSLRSGWAKVYVDGAYVDDSPVVNHELTPGTHTVRVQNDSTGVDETREIEVAAGKVTKVVF